ncbi:hypothetical protein [Streptomyces noursei]|uniref:hypothetical protein n=1 Tax=Streptomyces noursei TaxID=1971 RepID=UPI001671F843|nr:hypothetical protein [Streptomyces noursei]MCZ1021159.1 hypothetical protein [Streptomyces noursei]GGX54028.1 hypothetical protein GCM10010341_89040 [Streptomyces noursei]
MNTAQRAPKAAAPRSGTDFDLAALPWWRPCLVQAVGLSENSGPTLTAFVRQLLAAFEEQGHTVVDFSHGDVDLLLVAAGIPDGPAPLRERLPEQMPPLAVTACQEHGLRVGSRQAVVLAEVPERLGDLPHREIVELARTAMGRMAAAKVLFVSRGEQPGEVVEATLCTLEGGHPTETHRIADRMRDRLVSAACARDVADAYEVVPDAVPAPVWDASSAPGELARAGRVMGELGLLPPPVEIGRYVSPELARMYAEYMGWKRMSEGMLFLVDPELDALVVSASGSWDVDKRELGRDDVTIVGLDPPDSPLRVLAPEGRRSLGPSVETWEVRAFLQAVPKVRVARTARGTWAPHPDGEREVPLVRAGIHAHVGVAGADAARIETVPPDRERYPYGFGCGSDLMARVAADTLSRSRAVQDPGDPRLYVRWPMLYHGEMAVELWKPGLPAEPLAGLLDVFATGVDFRADHIEQPV